MEEEFIHNGNWRGEKNLCSVEQVLDLGKGPTPLTAPGGGGEGFRSLFGIMNARGDSQQGGTGALSVRITARNPRTSHDTWTRHGMFRVHRSQPTDARAKQTKQKEWEEPKPLALDFVRP